MKRISYAGGTLETGDDVAQAMLDYTTSVAQNETNITVEIPVREPNGKIAVHEIVLGPATQLVVSDIANTTTGNESTDFPVPDFTTPSEPALSEPPEDAERAAREFDRAVADIESELDSLGSE